MTAVRLGWRRRFRRFDWFRSGQGEPLRDGFPLVALGLHILVHRTQIGQALFGEVRACTQSGLGCHLFTGNGFGPEPMPVHFQISG